MVANWCRGRCNTPWPTGAAALEEKSTEIGSLQAHRIRTFPLPQSFLVSDGAQTSSTSEDVFPHHWGRMLLQGPYEGLSNGECWCVHEDASTAELAVLGRNSSCSLQWHKERERERERKRGERERAKDRDKLET